MIRSPSAARRAGIPLVVVVAVLLGVLVGLLAPAAGAAVIQAPVPAPAGPAQIEPAVRSYLGQWQPAVDPLITLQDGRQVKTSNIHGVDVDGVRYFYRPKYGYSADPVSRGVAARYEVVLVLEAGTQWETEVYRLR